AFIASIMLAVRQIDNLVNARDNLYDPPKAKRLLYSCRRNTVGSTVASSSSIAVIASCRPRSHIAIPMTRPWPFVAVLGNTNNRQSGALFFHLATISPRDLAKWYLQFGPLTVVRLAEWARWNRNCSHGTA